MSAAEKKHDYHLVDPSPWPIFCSFASLILCIGAVYYFSTKSLWLMIIGLAGFGLFAYTSFARSNIVTAKTKKEFATLELEYDEHKKSSHEKQIKIARELQTERNTVEELKAKLKAKNQSK